MADDTSGLSVPPKKLSHSELKEYAPGLQPRKMTAKYEKQKETLLRDRKSIQQLHKQRVHRGQSAATQKYESRMERKKIDREKKLYPRNREWKDADYFIDQYLKREAQMKTERVRARKIQNVEVKGNDEVMFVARVAADFECSPKVQKIFRELRLYKPYTAVFLRRSGENLKKLALVRRQIRVVKPIRQQVEDLIRTRGFAKVDKQRVALSSNQVIEERFGEHGFVCIEDLADTLMKGDEEKFNLVTHFMWPFKIDEAFNDQSNKVPGVGRSAADSGRHLQDKVEQFPFRFMDSLMEQACRRGKSRHWMGPELIKALPSKKEAKFLMKVKRKKVALKAKERKIQAKFDAIAETDRKVARKLRREHKQQREEKKAAALASKNKSWKVAMKKSAKAKEKKEAKRRGEDRRLIAMYGKKKSTAKKRPPKKQSKVE